MDQKESKVPASFHSSNKCPEPAEQIRQVGEIEVGIPESVEGISVPARNLNIFCNTIKYSLSLQS
jgi:hypothetical protein